MSKPTEYAIAETSHGAGTVTTYNYDARDLLLAIRAASIATSKDAGRPLLTAAHVSHTADSFTVASTDSYRLVIVECPSDHSDDGVPDYLLPGDLIGQVCKAFTAAQASRMVGQVATVTITDADSSERGSVTFTCTGTTLTSRVMTGTYPQYRDLIPAGETNLTGPVGYNPKYLSDIAKVAKAIGCSGADPVRVEFIDANKPTKMVMRSGNLTATYLLMPVRLSS